MMASRSSPHSGRVPVPPRPRLATLAWVGCLCAAAALAGCDRNRIGSILEPTGERPQPPLPTTGVIRGRVDFGNLTYPPTLVLVARVTAGFSSANTTIRVVGNHTTPEWTIPSSPRLTQLAPGVWVDTLRLESGDMEWKFVTDDVWENPSDYGTIDNTRVDGLENDLGVSFGSGNNLRASVPADWASAPVIGLVDETVTPPHYRFTKLGQGQGAYTSATDGTFQVTGLVAGTYHVLVRAPGQAPRTFENVVVDGITPADLGTISFGGATLGVVRGTLGWDPAVAADITSAPYPPTVVQLKLGATVVDQITTPRATNAFEFRDVAPGSYTIVADGHLFGAVTRDTIAVAGTTRDLGTLVLPFDVGELPSQMNLLGDFNGFPGEPFPDSTAMDQTQVGVWVYPNSSYPAQVIPADTSYMKFVTDGSYDNPTDFGGDESVIIDAPVTNAETRLVGGLGTALRVRFPATGQYRFTLDERRQTFTIEPLTAPRVRGAAWGRR